MVRRLIWLWLAGCGSGTAALGGPEGSSTGEAGETGGVSGASGVYEPTSGGPEEPLADDCTQRVAAHAEACSEEPCAISVDVEIRCPGYGFTWPGLRVAASPTTTWLVTSSDEDAMLFAADDAGVRRVDVLPPRFARETILLGSGPAGEVHAMVRAGRVLGPGAQELMPAAMLYVGPDGVSEEVVEASASGLVGFDVDADGAPHMWTEDFPGLSAWRRSDEGWTRQPAVAPEDIDWLSLGFDGQGATVAAGMREVESFESWQLVTRVGEREQVLGGPVLEPFPFEYVLLTPAAGDEVVETPLAAVIQHRDRLEVAWLTSQSSFERRVLPWSWFQRYTCPDEFPEDGCPGPCHEEGVGVEEGAFAFAATADGFGWVVHATTHLDRETRFDDPVDEDAQPQCSPRVVTDASYGVLFLTRVDFATGALKVALAQPFAGIDIVGLFDDGTSERGLDVRAHGTSLAIGLVTRGSDDAQVVRLLRVESTLLR